MALLAAPAVWRAIRGWHEAPPEYYISSRETRLTYGVLYLGLAAFLAVMTYELDLQLAASGMG